MKVHPKLSSDKKRWERDRLFSGGSRNEVQSPAKAFLLHFLCFKLKIEMINAKKLSGERAKSSHGSVPVLVITSPGHVNNSPGHV